MGAWGTSLYANDTTCDIRDEYVDKLRRGKTNEEVTQILMEENQDVMGNVEEEPLFWFALADTQWNYGRLLPEVKEKALYFLDQEEELERWRDSGERLLEKWMHTRNKLKEKLLSPQPPEKKVYKYRLYQCKWKLGDVFAYRFSSEYSKKEGFYGQSVVFRKVSEDISWPGHIVPVVQVYKWIGSDIPPIEKLADMKLLEQKFYSTVLERKPDVEREYEIILFNESERVIPKDNLSFLGNLPGDDLIPCPGDVYIPYTGVGWETQKFNNRFEKYVIEMYQSWKDIE